MTHSDDDGLVLPPRLAPEHVVLLPIYRNDEEQAAVLEYCRKLQKELEAQHFADGRVQVILDDRDMRGGEKNWHHVKRGVPMRLEIGPRDIAGRRRLPRPPRQAADGKERRAARAEFVATVGKLLDEMQHNLFQRALEVPRSSTRGRSTTAASSRRSSRPRTPTSPRSTAASRCATSPTTRPRRSALKALKSPIRCIPVEGDAAARHVPDHRAAEVRAAWWWRRRIRDGEIEGWRD